MVELAKPLERRAQNVSRVQSSSEDKTAHSTVKVREAAALELIERAFKIEVPSVIAFSGGKDSTVILDLVRRVRPDTPALFANTGVEYPETVAYARSVGNINEVMFEKSFWDCVKEYGFPQSKAKAKDGNKCCVYMKKRPMKKWEKEHGVKLVFLGITMAESRNRMMLLKHRGPFYACAGEGVFKCYPIWDWTEAEVWAYIKEHKLAYNPIYDAPAVLGGRAGGRGAVRCGCIPCTAYKSWRERLARENPAMYKFVLKKMEQTLRLAEERVKS